MGELTKDTPKPMLTVLGKTLIEWKLEALPDEITSVILVVGYKQDVIRNHFGSHWKHLPITYVEDTTLQGTGNAVALCKDYITDKTLVLMGDDIYTRNDLTALLSYSYAMLVRDIGKDTQTSGGRVVARDGILVGLNEGVMQTGIPSTLMNTGACVISTEYFTYPLVPVSPTEFGLPHTLVSLAKDHPVHVCTVTRWIQITSRECLVQAEQELLASPID